jgi:hypothetical protein
VTAQLTQSNFEQLCTRRDGLPCQRAGCGHVTNTAAPN